MNKYNSELWVNQFENDYKQNPELLQWTGQEFVEQLYLEIELAKAINDNNK